MCRDHCSMMRSFPHLERFHGEKKIRKEILKEDMERLLWYNDHALPSLHQEKLHDKKEIADEIVKVRKKTWGRLLWYDDDDTIPPPPTPQPGSTMRRKC